MRLELSRATAVFSVGQMGHDHGGATPKRRSDGHEKADEATKKTYDAIASKFGMVPNIFKGMANSPVTLNAYLTLDEMIVFQR